MRQQFVIAAATIALFAAPAIAQTGQAQTPNPKTGAGAHGSQAGKTAAADQAAGAVSAADRAFVKEAAVGGLAEVEMGNLAKDKASNADVKQFGERMVTDHGKANDQLKQWAASKNVTLPTELDAKHKAVRDRLSKLSGDAFDKAYMHDMVLDHQQDVAKFKKESQSAHDADLKNWAGQTLPTLQDHLKMAQDTAGKVGAGASKGTAKPKAPKK